MRGTRAAALVVLSTALLAGCGGGGTTEAAPPAEAGATASAAPTTPASLLEAAGQRLRTAGTGTVDTVIRASWDGKTHLQAARSAYDLPKERWSAAANVRADSPEDGTKTFTRTLVGDGPDSYVRIGEQWAAEARSMQPETWYRVPKEAPLEMVIERRALRTLLNVLLIVEQPSVAPGAEGGSVVTGTVPAAAAVELFGLTGSVLTGSLEERVLAGTAPVVVDLDAETNLRSVRISGKEIWFGSEEAVPAALLSQIRGTTFTATFAGLGEPVAITVPSDAPELTSTSG